MTLTRHHPDPLVGTSLDGRYRVDELIGSGGLCEVYRALDERLVRAVAVKILAVKHLNEPLVHERFIREGITTAQLKDPCVVGVYDQGTFQGRPFLILEYVPGGSARELLNERGAMPPYAAKALLEPILQALSVAHAAGFVHGDVKPENVVISHTGEVKLADFGSVREMTDSRGTTSALFPQYSDLCAEVYGTPDYLAPEQHTTDSWAVVTPAIDVYSAGILLYELLVGQLPFTISPNSSNSHHITLPDVPPPSRAVNGIPLHFDELVLRATEHDLRSRYPDARSMARELALVSHELSLPPYRVPAPTIHSSELQETESNSDLHDQIKTASLLSSPEHSVSHSPNPTVKISDHFRSDPQGEIASQDSVGNQGNPQENQRNSHWQRTVGWLLCIILLGIAALVCGYFLAVVVDSNVLEKKPSVTAWLD